MRVLLTLQHFHPMVPLAQALQAAGHEVAFAAPEDNRPAMEANGFTFFPAGRSMAELMPGLIPQFMSLREDERQAFVVGQIFGQLMPASLIPTVIALHDTWPFDLIVRDTTEIGGLIAAEALGLPHASVEIGVMPLPIIEPWLSANYNVLRTNHGLPPDRDMSRYFYYLHLAFVPPSYQDPALPYPATGHAFRHEVFDRSGDEALPDWVAGLPARPTVYVTLGTFFGAAQHIFRTIIDGLRDEDVNLIITVGRGQDPAALAPWPSNTHVERYIPQSLIFSHCDLVVCHGGWNTVLAALSYGLPLINIPVGADQPQNAARCAALGVGPTILPSELTPQHIRETMQTVLGDPGYRARSSALQAEMESLPGAGRAVELLEKLARDRQPILVA